MGPQKFMAANAAEALKMVRQKMGPEAMILSTNDVGNGVEVVAITSEDLSTMSANSENLDPEARKTLDNLADGRRLFRTNPSRTNAQRSGHVSGPSNPHASTSKPVNTVAFGRDLSVTRYSEFYSDPAPSARSPGAQSFRPARLEESERITTPSSPFGMTNQHLRRALREPLKPAQTNLAEQPAPIDQSFRPNPFIQAPIAFAPVRPAPAPTSAPTPTQTSVQTSVPTPTQTPAAQPTHQETLPSSSPKVDKLLAEINEVKHLLQSQVANTLWTNLQEQKGQVSEAVRHLLNAGFSPKLCSEITQNLPANLELPYLLKNARNQIQHQIKTLRPFDMFDQGGIYAFIGPTGVGKTTTIAKIAARCVLRYGRNQVALLTTDTYRIGAQEQLKTFAKILGLSVTALRDGDDLANKIKELSGRKIILLDTAGVSQRDTLMVEQSQLLNHGPSKTMRILVMSSTTDLRTQEEVINLHNQATQSHRSNKLDAAIITKIDEAAHLAPIVDSLIRHDLPILFVSNGQRVPEDLSLPDAAYLSHRAMASRAFSNDFAISDEQIPSLFSDHLGDWMRKVTQ